MYAKNPEQLINALQATVIQVEHDSGVSPDDPTFVALKRIVLQRIEDLELASAIDSQQPQDSLNSGEVIPAVDPVDAKPELAVESPQSADDKSD
ncbi:MAG: hypothetical protein WAM85_23090 [Terracidiphilus sp.]